VVCTEHSPRPDPSTQPSAAQGDRNDPAIHPHLSYIQLQLHLPKRHQADKLDHPVRPPPPHNLQTLHLKEKTLREAICHRRQPHLANNPLQNEWLGNTEKQMLGVSVCSTVSPVLLCVFVRLFHVRWTKLFYSPGSLSALLSLLSSHQSASHQSINQSIICSFLFCLLFCRGLAKSCFRWLLHMHIVVLFICLLFNHSFYFLVC
jgi:hypothetical protein